jgi:hypothetical protein
LLGSKNNRLSLLGSFVSNAFARDQIGAGLEFTLGQYFSFRIAYKEELDRDPTGVEATLDNGVAGGISASLPLKKGSSSRLSIDYGYRNTSVFNGIHSLGLRLDL